MRGAEGEGEAAAEEAAEAEGHCVVRACLLVRVALCILSPDPGAPRGVWHHGNVFFCGGGVPRWRQLACHASVVVTSGQEGVGARWVSRKVCVVGVSCKVCMVGVSRKVCMVGVSRRVCMVSNGVRVAVVTAVVRVVWPWEPWDGAARACTAAGERKGCAQAISEFVAVG